MTKRKRATASPNFLEGFLPFNPPLKYTITGAPDAARKAMGRMRTSIKNRWDNVSPIYFYPSNTKMKNEYAKVKKEGQGHEALVQMAKDLLSNSSALEHCVLTIEPVLKRWILNILHLIYLFSFRLSLLRSTVKGQQQSVHEVHLHEFYHLFNHETLFFTASTTGNTIIHEGCGGMVDVLKKRTALSFPQTQLMDKDDLRRILCTFIEPNRGSPSLQPYRNITAVSIVGELDVPLFCCPSITIRRWSALKVKQDGFYDYMDAKFENISVDDVVAPNSRFIILARFARFAES
jgi:hypothetical protein